jgi:hypothetical protein
MEWIGMGVAWCLSLLSSSSSLSFKKDPSVVVRVFVRASEMNARHGGSGEMK